MIRALVFLLSDSIKNGGITKASSEIRIKLNKIVEEHNFDINQFKNHSEFLNYKYKVHLEPEVAYKLVHRLYHYLFGLFSLNFLRLCCTKI